MNKSFSPRSLGMALGLALLLPLSGAHSAPLNMDPEVLPNRDFVEAEEGKGSVEDKLSLPPLPQPQDLVPIDTGPTATYSFALDAKSLTVGKDGVIRYTVVATSPSGSVNIFHEGFRCKTFEYRQYAFGSKNGKWVPARNERWQVVSSMAKNQSHYTLGTDYFCEGRVISGKAAEIIDRIRYQRRLTF